MDWSGQKCIDTCIGLESLIDRQSSLQPRRMVVNVVNVVDIVNIYIRTYSIFFTFPNCHFFFLRLIQSSDGLITIQASDRTHQSQQSQSMIAKMSLRSIRSS